MISAKRTMCRTWYCRRFVLSRWRTWRNHVMSPTASGRRLVDGWCVVPPNRRWRRKWYSGKRFSDRIPITQFIIHIFIHFPLNRCWITYCNTACRILTIWKAMSLRHGRRIHYQKGGNSSSSWSAPSDSCATRSYCCATAVLMASRQTKANGNVRRWLRTSSSA